MPPRATRLLDGFGSTTSGVSSSARDIYAVYNDTPDGQPVSIEDLKNPGFLAQIGVPNIGAVHPNFPGLRVRSLSTQSRGRGWEIDVDWSVPSLANFDRPPLDHLDPVFYTIEFTSRTEEVNLPLFSKTTVTIEGDEPATLFVWQRDEREFILEKSVEVMTATMSGTYAEQQSALFYINQFPTVRAQLNRLHKFGSTVYRFMGARRIAQESSSTNEEPARWTIQYEWEYDPGIPRGQDDATWRDGLLYWRQGDEEALAVVCQTDSFFILPYTRADVYEDSQNPTGDPIAVFTKPFKEDDNGWQSLPGMNR